MILCREILRFFFDLIMKNNAINSIIVTILQVHNCRKTLHSLVKTQLVCKESDGTNM